MAAANKNISFTLYYDESCYGLGCGNNVIISPGTSGAANITVNASLVTEGNLTITCSFGNVNVTSTLEITVTSCKSQYSLYRIKR